MPKVESNNLLTTGGHTQAGKGVHSKRTVADEAFIESINELIDAGDHDTVIDLVTKELQADPRNHAGAVVFRDGVVQS
jgi:hypothetical protein